MSRFENDWRRALRKGVVRLVMRYDDDGHVDIDEDGVPDECEEVGDAIWKHNQLVYALFTNYASLNLSMTEMTLNSFTKLVLDCELVQKNSQLCKARDFDVMFFEVNKAGRQVVREKIIIKENLATSSSATKPPTRGPRPGAPPAFLRQATTLLRDHSADSENTLTIVEFLVVIVRIAVQRYVQPGIFIDISDAVDELIGVVLQSKLGALDDKSHLSEPDHFRRGYCYSEPVCLVLKAHEALLHEIYDWIRAFECPLGVDPAKHLTLRVWMRATRALEVMNIDLSERDCLRCFSWSRTVVIDYKTLRGQYEATHLPFEGFMEALCRIAMQKALPTQAEMDEGGDRDAVAFIGRLSNVKAFLDERKRRWCSDEPVAGFEIRVKHIISIFKHSQRLYDQQKMSSGKSSQPQDDPPPPAGRRGGRRASVASAHLQQPTSSTAPSPAPARP